LARNLSLASAARDRIVSSNSVRRSPPGPVSGGTLSGPVAGSAEGAGGEREMIVGTKATELAVAAGAAMLVAGGRGEAVLAVVRACGGCVKSLAAIGQ
jgi:hypothetical protein